MSENAASDQTTNADSKKNIWLKVAIALLAFVALTLAIVQFRTAAERDTLLKQVQQYNEQARPPSGPSISAKFDKVQEGMTVQQVEEIMGPGERGLGTDRAERLEWKQQLKGGTWTFYVSVKDGKVSAKGSELK
jgi:heme exporter protein D